MNDLLVEEIVEYTSILNKALNTGGKIATSIGVGVGSIDSYNQYLGVINTCER